jgi:hypothetical protein
MCIDKILSLFKKKNTSVFSPEPGPVSEPKPIPEPTPETLSIPHPEEAPDYSKTIESTDLDSALNEWEVNYSVPEMHREYWKTKISMQLNADLPYPSATYEKGGVRYLTIRPAWVNTGVIAHEQAHNSYALLSEEQKTKFSAIYTPLKTTDPLIVLLYSINSYGLTSDIEGYAEVYRYLGEKMPEELKEYYPRLF